MKEWDIDAALDKLKSLPSAPYFDEKLTESDTRSKLIDFMLKDVLGWKEEDIIREERVIEDNTYLDYKLSTNIPQIIIEAKQSNFDLKIPTSTKQLEFVVGGVLQNSKPLISAMIQARDYAVSKGILFCVVTNGKQYVFFRSQNSMGLDWIQHKCIVFRSISEIKTNFEFFARLLSKSAVENGILHKTLQISDDFDNEINKYKTLDTKHISIPRKRDRNPLFPYIGEIIHRVFQDLATKDSETEILEHCYVDSPQKSDKLTPYFDQEIKLLYVSKKDAGDFQQKILSSLNRSNLKLVEVILLIGSVGVGKSTFLQRFRKVLAKDKIDKNGIWIYVNFKHYSDTGDNLDKFIFSQIEATLSNDYNSLGLDEWNFIKQAYHKEHEKYKIGVLSPLFKSSPEKFEEKFGEIVLELMKEDSQQHIIKILSTASKRLSKSLFLVFDNADQLNPDIQNKIFLAAQKLAESLSCLALIAMREESYWKNRTAGPLNAFHTTAYHVQPPTLIQVLSKRFQYSKELIQANEIESFGELRVTNEELIEVFNRLVQTLLSSDTRYIKFIEAISARDMRRALDLIATFMISGHTNIEALLKDVRRVNPKELIIPFHEFLNAIILKDYEIYSELNSDVINLFNLTGSIDVSNFNLVAVLGRILHAQNIRTSDLGVGYILIEEVINDCHSVGIQPDTTSTILNKLNARRLIETETTIKESLDKSKYVRATIAGKYYIEELVKLFGYLDLIIYETPICNNARFNKLKEINNDIKLITGDDGNSRFFRVEKRLQLCEEFISYLNEEFSKCQFKNRPDIFSADCINLIEDIKVDFNKEKSIVIERAKNLFNITTKK